MGRAQVVLAPQVEVDANLAGQSPASSAVVLLQT